MISPIPAKVRPVRKTIGITHNAIGECTKPSKVITIRIAVPDIVALLAAHSHSPATTSSSDSGAYINASQVFCTCMREKAEYSDSKVAAFMVEAHSVPAERNAIYGKPFTVGNMLPRP